MTLHTSAHCSIHDVGAFTGTMTTPNCDVNAPGQHTNAGCQIASHDPTSYGMGFNAAGGGVYATEWTSNAVSIWFFPRGSIPDDLAGGNPEPSQWGKPTSRFQGDCNIDDKLKNHNLIFDVTFCGDWAGNVWDQDSICSSKAPTCQAFVQNNPAAFTEAFWQINSLKVFQSKDEQAIHVPPPPGDPLASENADDATQPEVAIKNLPPPPPPPSTPAPIPPPGPAAATSPVRKRIYQFVDTVEESPIGALTIQYRTGRLRGRHHGAPS